MATIVLISCASQKQAAQTRARDLYTSTLFKYSLAYAEQLQPDTIFILSAKHGLLTLDRLINPYNQTLNEMPAAEVRAWAHQVVDQLRQHARLERDHFIILAGKRYRQYLVPYIRSYEVPMEGKRIGEQLQYLKEATT